MKTKRIAYCHPGASFNDCYNAALSEYYDEFLWNGSRFPVRPTEEGGTTTKPTCAGHPIMWGVVEYAQPVDRWLEGWRAGREAAARSCVLSGQDLAEGDWGPEGRDMAVMLEARILAMAEPDGVGKPDTTAVPHG